MSANSPLSDAEVYDLLHNLWLQVAGKRGDSEHGEVAIRRVLNVIQVQQGTLVAHMEGLASRDPDQLF